MKIINVLVNLAHTKIHLFGNLSISTYQSTLGD